MQASNKKSDEAQALDSSALERAAVVFAFTRLFALLMLADMFRLAAVVETHPFEAARIAIVREARALFWECIRAMRDADKAWSL
jgi:hypothetical protein